MIKMSATSDNTIYRYPDRGNNCVECDSTTEPDKYICTVCLLAGQFSQLNGGLF
ncbi:hypothetical protein HBNXHx_1758 [Haloferax volcanii]|nr:hypothetical protein HBNXHx_1758 [Haloferax alexandrinus]